MKLNRCGLVKSVFIPLSQKWYWNSGALLLLVISSYTESSLLQQALSRAPAIPWGPVSWSSRSFSNPGLPGKGGAKLPPLTYSKECDFFGKITPLPEKAIEVYYFVLLHIPNGATCTSFFICSDWVNPLYLKNIDLLL